MLGLTVVDKKELGVNSPSANSGKIVLSQVTKVFSAAGASGRPTQALAPIDIEIPEGKFVAVVGPSGCGKTSLLNIVAGFEHPTSGTAFCSGRPVRGPGHDRLVVFQEDALFPWLTVWQNVIYGPKITGMLRATYEAAARDCLSIMGLTGFENHLPVELSGGMKQRVALARVLVMQPEVLLMDEPFAALDAQTRTLMQELLVQTREQYFNTAIFITHDVDEAIFLADVIYVMSARPGRIKMKIDVSLPRPRSFEVLTNKEFTEIKRTVLDLIHKESIRAASQEASFRLQHRN